MLVPWAIVLTALICTVAFAGVPWVDTDFETDPISEGWGSTTPLGDPGNQWTMEDAFSGTHCLRVEEGSWVSPIVDLEPFAYYSMSMRARAPGRGYFGPSYKATAIYNPGGGWEPNVHAFRGRHDKTETRIQFQPPAGGSGYIDDVVIEPIRREEATAILDEQWLEMPPFTMDVGRARKPRLRRTFRALENGETVRVVMLGDSIIDDTSHSYFELLVERLYPGSRIEVVTSTRGSTGCWWFRETEPETGVPRVTTWVTDFDPDLVMIGGISHGEDGPGAEIDATRDVIRQIRDWNAETDIILMTVVGGTNDPVAHPELLERADPEGPDWRARLHRLAIAEHVAYIDMTTAWARYVVSTGLPLSDLLRDAIHLNERGSAVAGRILEAWFSPEPRDRPGRSRGTTPRPTGPNRTSPGEDPAHGLRDHRAEARR